VGRQCAAMDSTACLADWLALGFRCHVDDAHTTIGKLARVCVVGNAALDLSLRVERLPVAGETSLAVETLLRLSAARAPIRPWSQQRAGTPTQLFAAIGQDAEGDRIAAQLSEEGIDTSHVIDRVPCPTDMSIITVDARGENTIVTRNDAAGRYHPEPRSGRRCNPRRRLDRLAGQPEREDFTAQMLLRPRGSARAARCSIPGPCVSIACRCLATSTCWWSIASKPRR
jgi:ribokinase